MLLLVRIAWRNIWRHRRRTLITAGAMAVGVAFCMAMIALMDGMYAKMFDQMVTESLGHAQIHHPEFPKKRAIFETVDDGEALRAQLEALPEVEQASARIYGYTLLGTEQASAGAQIIGIDPVREARLTHLDAKVVDGRFLGAEAGDELLLGVDLAERLQVGPGAELVAVTQAADGSLGNELYTVVGILRTGMVVHDRSGAFLHLDDASELLVLDGQVHEISLVGPGKEQVTELVAAVAPVVEGRGLLLRSWDVINPQLAQMLAFGDAASVFLLGFVFAVAALGVLNTMLMSVFERTKELGVIRALGLGRRQMIALVILETFALAAVATAIGVPLGLGLDAWLVFYGLDLSAVYPDMSVLGTAFDPVMVGRFDIGGVLQTVIGLFVISFLASLWPALRVARLQPVAAMRME